MTENKQSPTCPSLSVKWTIHSSLRTLEPVLLVCLTDCTTLCGGGGDTGLKISSLLPAHPCL